ncbi:MAG: divalent metal cation transporter [Gemmatimonadaceae bacterium]|nr:divalent metal cation transporter [Gemmatimonadaceae bacterium]
MLLGAAFLMATSAIGPGFLTQTAVFTERLGASFGFAILVSILFDLAAQLTIWRVLVASGERADVLADRVLPGLGKVLSLLVVAGGLAFNVGNVAGAGLGLRLLTGIPLDAAVILSASIAVLLFVVKEAGRAMDRFALVLGVVMVVVTWGVAISAAPPWGEAAVRSIAPVALDAVAIVTIVGGTVGGYITFAGAHRLLDAGVRGPSALPLATRAAGTAIGIASVMRVALFLAALAVVSRGVALGTTNPAAAVFDAATGPLGSRAFGLVMWAAAVTSIVGSAYTSVSFLRRAPAIERQWPRVVIAFIALSTVIFLMVGRPVRVLVLVGLLNGLVLPLSIGAVLLAARRHALVPAGTLPRWLTAIAAAVGVAMTALGASAIATSLREALQ